MSEERSVGRLTSFTDAVVAIAITLLVLPLAEVPRTSSGAPDHPLGQQLLLDIQPFLGLLISFFVIARLWWAHHRTFEPVERYSTSLVVVDVVWVFTIVLLPATTAIIPEYDPVRSPLPVLLYVGVCTLSSLALTFLTAIVHRSPEVAPTRGTATRKRLVGTAATTVAFAAALVLGTTVPLVNYWALLLTALTAPFEILVNRALLRRDTRRTASEQGARLAGTARAVPTPAETSSGS